MGMIWSLAIVLLLLGPSFLYSNFNFQHSHEIKKGSFAIDLLDGSDRLMLNLFNSTLITDNRRATMHEVDEIFKTNEYRKYERFRINIIEFSKVSDKYFQLTPHVLGSMRKFLATEEKKYLKLNFTFWTDNYDTTSTLNVTHLIKNIEINEGTQTQLKTLTNTGCQGNSEDKKMSESYFTVIYTMLEIKMKEMIE